MTAYINGVLCTGSPEEILALMRMNGQAGEYKYNYSSGGTGTTKEENPELLTQSNE